MGRDGEARLVVRKGQIWKSNSENRSITILTCEPKSDECVIKIKINTIHELDFGLFSKRAVIDNYHLISSGQYPIEKFYI